MESDSSPDNRRGTYPSRPPDDSPPDNRGGTYPARPPDDSPPDNRGGRDPTTPQNDSYDPRNDPYYDYYMYYYGYYPFYPAPSPYYYGYPENDGGVDDDYDDYGEPYDEAEPPPPVAKKKSPTPPSIVSTEVDVRQPEPIRPTVPEIKYIGPSEPELVPPPPPPPPPPQKHYRHNAWFVALLIVCVIVGVILIIFHILAQFGYNVLFYNQFTGLFSKTYALQISPAAWFFWTWFVVALYHCVFLIYMLHTVFSKISSGRPVYTTGENPILMLVLFMISNCFLIAWLFLIDRGQLEGAYFIVLLASASLVAALVIAVKSMARVLKSLVMHSRIVQVWLTRGIVHNFLAFYASWCSFLTALHLAFFMCYTSYSSVSIADASCLGLSFYMCLMIVYIPLDILLFDKFVRYVLSPYLFSFVAILAAISNNTDSSNVNDGYLKAIVTILSLGILLKLVLTIINHQNDAGLRDLEESSASDSFASEL